MCLPLKLLYGQRLSRVPNCLGSEHLIGEVLPCIREPGNRHDPHTVAIAVTRHEDTPIITPASLFSVHLMEILVGKILANG